MAPFESAGAAQGGIIPYSLSLAPQIRNAGTFVLLPAADHKPLRQLSLSVGSPVFVLIKSIAIDTMEYATVEAPRAGAAEP